MSPAFCSSFLSVPILLSTADCDPGKSANPFQNTSIDGILRCPGGETWKCSYKYGIYCPQAEDEHKPWPVCKQNHRMNYADCLPKRRNLFVTVIAYESERESVRS